MRTIKFRGLTEEGKWIEGFYGILGKDTDIESHIIMQSTLDTQSNIDRFYFTDVPIISGTSGPFIGLYDKNGKEIYEGDIIRVNTYVNVQYEVFEPDELVRQEIITEVSYNELFGAFELITIEEDLYLKSWGFYNEDENNELEIIGNIHENPELLK